MDYSKFLNLQFNDIQVVKAVREKLIGAIMLQAPSGAGKTTSALLLAYGMMKAKYPELKDEEIWIKIGVVDTEHKRSLVNVGMQKGNVTIGHYKFVEFNKPYSIERAFACFTVLKQQGVEVIIFDSTSHVWEGTGGIQDYQQALGGRFQDWRTANKDAYEPFVDLVTGVVHEITIINTARTKQEHAMVTNELGKTEVQKLGMKPIQRDSLEYEFQIVFNIDMDHKARVSKDNSGLFESMSEAITPEHGKLIYEWLDEGKDILAEKKEKERIENEKRLGLAADIHKQATDFNLLSWLGQTLAHPYFNVSRLEDLDMQKLEEIRKAMQPVMEQQEANGNV